MLKGPLSPRLLKKVQMQGGVTHPADGYPARREAYLRRTSQRRASAGAPTAGGSPQMGLFQQSANRNPHPTFRNRPSHTLKVEVPSGRA